MKKLLFLLSTFSCLSQNVNYDKKDDFDGSRKINVSIENRNSSVAFASNIISDKCCGLYFDLNSIIKENKVLLNFIEIEFLTDQTRCFSDSKITFLFDNDEKLTLNQISKIDCGKTVKGKFELSISDIQFFIKNKVKKIRILTTDGYIDTEIKEKKKQKILDTFLLFNKTIQQP